MPNAKGRGKDGNTGAEEALGPVDYVLGGAKSRAAARLLAEQQVRDAMRIQAAQQVKDPLKDPESRLEVVEEKDSATGGKVIHFVCIPKGMSAAEVMGRAHDP